MPLWCSGFQTKKSQNGTRMPSTVTMTCTARKRSTASALPLPDMMNFLRTVST